MRKAAVLVLALFFGAIGWVADASALTIADDYIGADPSGTGWDGRDVIGAKDLFDISRMEVDLVGDRIVVDIYSAYLDNIGECGTELGDLFVSIDGWDPVLSTELDGFYSGGEDWEFVVALDDHRDTSGTARLYPLDQTVYGSDILLSDDLMDPRYIFREGQEVQYGGPADGWLTAGDWSVMGDFLRISVDAMGVGWNFSDLHTLGLHYTMTCGNDVIEGAVPNPEPGTVLLLGAGLLGLAGLRRKGSRMHRG